MIYLFICLFIYKVQDHIYMMAFYFRTNFYIWTYDNDNTHTYIHTLSLKHTHAVYMMMYTWSNWCNEVPVKLKPSPGQLRNPWCVHCQMFNCAAPPVKTSRLIGKSRLMKIPWVATFSPHDGLGLNRTRASTFYPRRRRKEKMYWKGPALSLFLSPSSTLSPLRCDAPGRPQLRAGARIRWPPFWAEPLNFCDQNDHFTSRFRQHCANSIQEMDNTCKVWQGGICFGSTLVWEIIIQPL